MTAVLPTEAPRAPLDLSRPLRLHVVGVGGPGMSAIAIALAEMGHHVSGSDVRDQPVLDRVRAAGVHVQLGHSAEIVVGCDAVTSSTAIPDTNLELRAARERGVPTLRRAGMLAAICAQARSIGVAGTHGKTTTTSMLMLMLARAGLAPSFIVGGDVMDAGTGAHWTGGELLVVEADESDGTHVELPLAGTILLNVELDFLQHYGTFDALLASFDRYLAHIDGPRVLCADDPVCADLATRYPSITYGLGPTADVRAVELRSAGGSFSFAVERRGERSGDGRAAVARGAQRRQRHRCHRHGPRARRPVRGVPRGARPLRRRRPALRHPWRRRRAPRSWTTTGTCRRRSPPSSPPPATAATGGGG